MVYVGIWTQYRKSILPMSALIAWLWLFPLFGSLQKYIVADTALLLAWNFSFLAGLTGTFLMSGFMKSFMRYRRLLIGAPIVCLGLMGVSIIYKYLFSSPMPNPPGFLHASFHYLLPALSGVAVAQFFVFWGASISHLPVSHRGRFMGLTMGLAVAFSISIQAFDQFTSLSFLLGCGLLVLAASGSPAMLREWQPPDTKQKSSGVLLQFDSSRQNQGKNFWLPFTLVLFCYYLLGGISHHTLFPLAAEFIPLLGNLSYGIVALACGYYIDCRQGGENIPLIALAALGFTFLFLPLAIQFGVFIPLQIMLESSYAIVDMLIWFGLAMAVTFYGGNPVTFYGWGLFLNVFFISLGVLFDVQIGNILSGHTVFYVSIFAGMILFSAVFPALILRRAGVFKQPHALILSNLTKEEAIALLATDFTPREKEIVRLILLGLDNQAIAKSLLITKNTLKTHIRHIYVKAGVGNRSELIIKNRETSDFTS